MNNLTNRLMGHLTGGWCQRDRLIMALNLLLIAYLALLLARSTWELIGSGTGAALVPSAVVLDKGEAGVVALPSLEQARRYHLFGEINKVVTAAPVETQDAPETRLNLTLRGVFAAADGLNSVAIIAASRDDEQAYQIGDALPGGATIEAIHADRVMLRRGGRLETLRLPKDEALGGMAVESSREMMAEPVSGAKRLPPAALAQIKSFRQRAITDPQSAMALARFESVMEGGTLKGYKLFPGSEPRLFYTVGLRPGDVVTEVNGIRVTDLGRMGELYQQMTQARQLNVSVERKGIPTQLSLSLE